MLEFIEEDLTSPAIKPRLRRQVSDRSPSQDGRGQRQANPAVRWPNYASPNSWRLSNPAGPRESHSPARLNPANPLLDRTRTGPIAWRNQLACRRRSHWGKASARNSRRRRQAAAPAKKAGSPCQILAGVRPNIESAPGIRRRRDERRRRGRGATRKISGYSAGAEKDPPGATPRHAAKHVGIPLKIILQFIT